MLKQGFSFLGRFFAVNGWASLVLLLAVLYLIQQTWPLVWDLYLKSIRRTVTGHYIDYFNLNTSSDVGNTSIPETEHFRRFDYEYEGQRWRGRERGSVSEDQAKQSVGQSVTVYVDPRHIKRGRTAWDIDDQSVFVPFKIVAAVVIIGVIAWGMKDTYLWKLGWRMIGLGLRRL
ncbi:DUF3592 domain-containing protein [Lacticaseibacillus hegangensis]|uniref:DUF3592 domain-containing protein n=1 Tax=Lacticaseibacillus hegangensis TaxID=2486010 RepID=A0ABW4D041_9LACO|nr:hypothetical protein [Lacticaseibacillus hegangensis]